MPGSREAGKPESEWADISGNAASACDSVFARKIVNCLGMLLFRTVVAIRLVRKQCDGPPS